jgi:hypothetical protein
MREPRLLIMEVILEGQLFECIVNDI